MLTPQGFKRKRYAEIVADMEFRAKELFGEDTNTSDKSPIGIFIRLVSWFLSLFAQDLENTYNNGIVDKSEGVNVDYHLKRIGSSRQKAFKSTGEITINGDDETFIGRGFIIETKTDIQFMTTDDAVISVGSATVPIEAVEAGVNGNVLSNTITEIVNPQVGVDSVTNLEPTSGGRNKQSDADAIKRYYDSLSRGGSSTVESIRATLLDVEGVRDAIVLENDTMDTVDGLPPKCIAPFVNGGNDQDVANAIMGQSKAGGIQSFGSTIAIYIDSLGNEKPVGFTRPDIVQIYVNAELETNSSFPVDGNQLVRNAIIKYIGGQDEDATEYNGLGLDQDVVFTKVISAIHSVSGIDDITLLEIGTDPFNIQTSGNITIQLQEIAETDFDKVVVL